MDTKASEHKSSYDNSLAFKELLKMMRRKERLTISYVHDKEGYDSAEIESKRVAKFTLRLTDEIMDWIFTYLFSGKISEPLPDIDVELVKGSDHDSNAFATKMLKIFLSKEKALNAVYKIPEIIDKPGRLNIMFLFAFGVFDFKVKRTPELTALLESKDI